MTEPEKLRVTPRKEWEPYRQALAATAGAAFIAITQMATRFDNIQDWKIIISLACFLMAMPVLAVGGMPATLTFICSGKNPRASSLAGIVLVVAIYMFLLGLVLLAASFGYFLWLGFVVSVGIAAWLLFLE
jgi:hypothetical protein